MRPDLRVKRTLARIPPDVGSIVLLSFMGLVWLGGGASRADVAGQVVVRAAAGAGLVILALFGRPPDWARVRTPALFLAAILLLIVAQLVPLPYSVWAALPGRGPFAAFDDLKSSWMPLTLTPGATVNALLSLTAPALTMLAIAGCPAATLRRLLPVMTAMIFAGGLFGAFQLSVGTFDNPLLNNTPWQVSGPFANRNHYALFMAFGCLLAPAWACSEVRRLGWTSTLALGLGLAIFFLLMILASGSRAGLVLGVVGLVAGLALSYQMIAPRLKSVPRAILPVFVAAAIAVIGLFVAISFGWGRAASIDRLLGPADQEDLRMRALPTVIDIIEHHFPAGAGIGGFSTVFRIHEPLHLLKPTIFNHAHNDFAEVIFDAGAPGLLLIAAAAIWWARASMRAWHRLGQREQLLPRLGSVMMLLVFMASAVDYPARTPLIMSMIVIAATWLNGGSREGAHALPRYD